MTQFKYIIFMNLQHISISLLFIGVFTSPILLITQDSHLPIFNSQQLLQYASSRNHLKIIDITTEEDEATVQKWLKQFNISKTRVSSFFTTSQQEHIIKSSLSSQDNFQFEAMSLESFKVNFKTISEDVILNFNFVPIRIMVETKAQQNQKNQTSSQLFNNMTSYSLSGIMVGLFVLVMLAIGISCAFDLKTNDRFARQNLWVGRES